jgi:Fe-S-cluster containining protein
MNTITSFPFFCKMMGTCCIHNQVVLNPLDIFHIAKALEVPAKYLFSNKIITYIINQKDMWMEPIIHLNNEVCPFLVYKSEIQKICDIHESRPTVCRIYPLNYNIQNDSVSIPENAMLRCRACFETDNDVQIDEYIQESKLDDKLNFYKKYIDFKNDLIMNGFNLNGIKGNTMKRKKFFKIQEILFEKYPSSSKEKLEFSWEEIKLEIKDVIEIE